MLLNNTYETIRVADVQKDGSIVYTESPISDAEISEMRSESRKELLTKDFIEARNLVLSRTDWTQLPDAPLSADLKEEYRVYRQALRDITLQPDFPFIFELPDEPMAK